MLRAGGKVAYLDFEAAAPEIVGRLLVLGATTGQISAGLYYSTPEVSAFYEKGDFQADHNLLKKLEPRPQFIVINGFFTAMVSSGLDAVKNSDLVHYRQESSGPWSEPVTDPWWSSTTSAKTTADP